MTSNTVYVVFSCRALSDQIAELIDDGLYKEATRLSGKVNSFYDTVKTFCEYRGGHVHLLLLEKAAIEVPSSAAAELLGFVEQFEREFHMKVAVGVGLTMTEAGQSAAISEKTGEIELHGADLGDPKISKEKTNTGETDPPDNMFDPVTPEQPDQALTDPKEKKAPKGFSPEEDSKANRSLVDSLLDELGANDEPPAPPPQQMMAPPGAQEEQGQPDQPQEGQQPGAEKVPEEDVPEEVEEKAEPEEDEHQYFTQRLGESLAAVRLQLPKIMKLADKNPEAFKQAMSLAHKLVAAAKGHMKKAQSDFPVGTTLNGKKKIIVDGKVKWRSLRSGAVMDSQGQAVSSSQAPKIDQKTSIKG